MSTYLTTGTRGRQHLVPDVASDTVALIGATQTLTGKTIDADGSGNSIQNINATECDSITGDTFGIPFVIQYALSNKSAAVHIFNANAPFKFKVIRAWSIATSADGGTWKLNNGSADLTGSVTVAESNQDLDEPATYAAEATRTIAANGTLDVVPDASGLLDCVIYIQCLRVD